MSLPALVAAMLRPEFYPHRPPEVTLVQTHISYVLLAGDQVYKLKKPVHFSFLDFSTLERRRHLCREEVRLNRRLTDGIYLDVLGVVRRDGEYCLAPEDDPHAVEYAVHMRRLPAERMLDQLLDRQQVTTAMIDAIADRLVAFHQSAAAGPEVTANGAAAAVARILEDNYTNARPFRGVTISARDDDAIQRFAHDFLNRNDALLRARQAQHRIRDCHGDLHTEHICFAATLQIFDCVEFNPLFRYCDVASDIAFLAMDLDFHGHSELAAHLVACYAAAAHDADLPRLVPFYQCYRAYVRGKVDSLKSAEEEVTPAEREAARRSAWRHFALAYRYTWAYSPCLVVVAGLSGTGKSANAAALHTRTGFAHINSDIVRKRLAGVSRDVRIVAGYDEGLYTPELSARTYDAMFAAADSQLAAGHGVILDATFSLRIGRDQARALAAKHRVPLLFVECQCAEAEVHRRLAERVQRGEGPSDADWNVYVEQRRRYEPFAADEATDHLVLDTAGSTGDLTAAIEDALRERTGSTLLPRAAR